MATRGWFQIGNINIEKFQMYSKINLFRIKCHKNFIVICFVVLIITNEGLNAFSDLVFGIYSNSSLCIFSDLRFNKTSTEF